MSVQRTDKNQQRMCFGVRSLSPDVNSLLRFQVHLHTSLQMHARARVCVCAWARLRVCARVHVSAGVRMRVFFGEGSDL